MKAILNLIDRNSGTIIFDEKSMESIKKKTSYIEQMTTYDLNFPIIVKDVVMLGAFPRIGLFKYPNKKHKNQALEVLKEVDLHNFAESQIGELSGGQLQRVFLARVLMQDAEIIFLDEPFKGIDADNERKIIKILKKMKEKGKTIIMVYHDLSKVNDYFDEIIILNKEIIAYGDVKTTFTKENITKAYAGSFTSIFNEEVSS